ncbi:MAG: hypothetical protein CFH34_00055 [Alphaproteobacteria bacterium MarineAlpha9_Bin4]|nr:phosphoesterase [Pelagibacterales bacterium]PPR27575.1 MAG: hypothetical protein CFH34_00055 [Alphaproteobacteria bacterium MarineAlpha9_Bin4]|tara:strand:- start:26 stop:676 length:651 start_codon:yes stop_codon:yes gene_type:complete
MSNKILFANKELFLQFDGSIYWPEKKSLILGDLHLEKSSYFAKLGNFLPPYDSIETISRLELTLRALEVKKIILLGDIFHDKEGINRLSKKLRLYLNNLCRSFEVIWLVGNHDGHIRPKQARYLSEYQIDNISFNHRSLKNNDYELSGHYHPKATIKLFKIKISKPCFLVGESKIILPAYGAFTGGIDAKDKIFKNIFNNKYKTYVLLNEKILKVI